MPYIDAYRRALHRKFTALRVWSGASLVFFTLNPADTKHPFTIAFGASATDVEWAHAIPLDASDDVHRDCRSRLPPLYVHEVVARGPVAAVRCFHTLVKLVVLS